MWPIVYAVLTAITHGCVLAGQPNKHVVVNVEADHTFSMGHQFYRTLLLDENALYVGAMNNVYRLWMFNVNDTSNTQMFAHTNIEASGDALTRCAYRSHSPDVQCQNHMRVIGTRMKNGDSLLYACGTNAADPLVYDLKAADLTPAGGGNGAAICPVDPDDEATAVFVSNGNPSGIPSVYSGTVTDFTQTDRIIYRPPLVDEKGAQQHPFMRTMHTDNKWLNSPSFVASFDIGSYVYFFFRESSVEHMSCGPVIYSRVARICKSDEGGVHVLKQNWATYVKARLNCSLPGVQPFYFDQIQSVFKTGNGASTTLHATMSTSSTGFYGSAVCSFRLTDIDRVLDEGVYAEQTTSTSQWLPVHEQQVPQPRASTCAQSTQSLSDSTLHFVKSHLLIFDSVPSMESEPWHVRDVILTKLVVDELEGWRIVFAATDTGEVYKIRTSATDKSEPSVVLAVYKLADQSKVHAMQLLTNEYLYIAQDSSVTQLNVFQCTSYTTCLSCTADPYCSFSSQRRECHRVHDSHQYTAGWLRGSQADCSAQVAKGVDASKLAYPGDTAHLTCGDTMDGISTLYWSHNSDAAINYDDRIVLTATGGLIIMNMTKRDAGDYVCRREGIIVSQWQLSVDDVNCQQPQTIGAFQSAYKEWCREFQNYKQTMSKWQMWYERNTHCSDAPHFKALADGSYKTTSKSSNIRK